MSSAARGYAGPSSNASLVSARTAAAWDGSASSRATYGPSNHAARGGSASTSRPWSRRRAPSTAASPVGRWWITSCLRVGASIAPQSASSSSIDIPSV